MATVRPDPPAEPAVQPPYEADPLTVAGPSMTLRYATRADVPRLFELGQDPAVTRFFSWGPYTEPAQPAAYVDALAGKRERGELLEFVVDHREDGVIGVTGLTEHAARDRRATVGTWFGRPWWGSGVNPESKALVLHLGFERLGLERVTAWANTTNGRSQTALERLGFRREGVLAAWHRHGDVFHDVVVYAMLRADWERSPLREVPARVRGTPPPAFAPA